ncbi:hypothetical protein BH10PSE18_BH10PSE18_11600 [soil metagenome]
MGVPHEHESLDTARFADQMIGLVSHDLRNPLSTIEMGTQLLARGELGARERRVLSHITSANGRAQRMVADLLDFALVRFGHGLAVAPAPVSLHTLVAECVESLTRTHAGALLEHDRLGEGVCHADAGRLVQLIGNLVANALAYGAPGRPVIVASIVEPDSFCVAVHNEGPPIAQERMRDLFEPATSRHATPSGRSVGLGLFIVRHIALAHGGEVRARSDASGTTFTASFRRDADAFDA